jgi:hypothetical protein
MAKSKAAPRRRRAVKIDWTKVDATTQADIDRQARQDGVPALSEKAWEKLVRENRVVSVPAMRRR